MGAAVAVGLLVTGCAGTLSGASISTPINLPSRSPQETPAAAASSPAASTSSGSDLIWLWVVLGAIVLILLIVLIARSGRRRGPKPADVWRSRAIDAYAKGSALHDAMQLAEAPGALVAQDAAARWADIQRRADDLGQALYAMREAAPDEDKRMRSRRRAGRPAGGPLGDGRRARQGCRQRAAAGAGAQPAHGLRGGAPGTPPAG